MNDGRKHTGEAGGVLQNTAGAAHHKVETDGLHDCQDKGRVPGDLLDGLLSFGAFLSEPLKGRDRYGQQLNDNGGVDVRRNGHGKDVRLFQAAAGHDVQVA